MCAPLTSQTWKAVCSVGSSLAGFFWSSGRLAFCSLLQPAEKPEFVPAASPDWIPANVRHQHPLLPFSRIKKNTVKLILSMFLICNKGTTSEEEAHFRFVK